MRRAKAGLRGQFSILQKERVRMLITNIAMHPSGSRMVLRCPIFHLLKYRAETLSSIAITILGFRSGTTHLGLWSECKKFLSLEVLFGTVCIFV